MKAKKIVAVVMGAALAGTLAIGMSACSGGKKPESLKEGTLNIANYADEFENYKSMKGFTSAKTLFSGKHVVRDYGSGIYVIESNEKYSLYSAEAEKEIITNLPSMPWGTSIGSLRVYYVNTSEDNYNEIAYYAEDGTEILPAGEYSSLNAASASGAYVGSDTKPCTVYMISGFKTVVEDGAPTTKEVEVYVKSKYDKNTKLTSYTVVNKSDIKAYAPEYAVGGDQSGLKTPVYEVYEDYPVEGEIKNYEYSLIGTKYTFFNGSEKTGTVDLTSSGYAIGFMDSSLYYIENTVYVEGDHSGYNIAITGEATGVKYSSTLYKYDIIANTTTKLNYDVAVTRLTPLYNHETKTYDAAIISGYKMVDGVATYGSNNFTYLINKDFQIGYDMTGIFSGMPEVYDLGNGKYYIGGYVTDGEFNALSYVDDKYDVYADEGLISISVGYNYGFTDLSGKVVVAPEYSSSSSNIRFYGGVAHLYNMEGEVLLKKDGTVTKISDLEKSADPKVTKEVDVSDNGYYTITTVTEVVGGDDKVEVAYYAYDGTLLKSFNHDNVRITYIGNNSYVIKETVVDNNDNVSVNVYKVS